MARNRTVKPVARFWSGIGAHRLSGELWSDGWRFVCDSFPDLAEKYAGVTDATEAIEEFTRRATADQSQPKE
jgi:hypothetical protein